MEASNSCNDNYDENDKCRDITITVSADHYDYTKTRQ